MDYQRITDVPAVSDVAGSDSVYIRQGDTFRRISVADFLQALGITDGVSPTVTVAIISGGHRITITDADGTKTIDVMDGATGADGSDGNDGADGGYYTPVVDQAIPGSISFGFTPSKSNMPTIKPTTIPLPAGPQGAAGLDGGYYQPSVSDDGILSWTPSKAGMPEVPDANIASKPILPQYACAGAGSAAEKTIDGVIPKVDGYVFAVDFYSANTAVAPFLSDGENTFGIIRAGQTQQFVPGNLVAGTHIFVLRGNYAFLINPNLGDASAIAAAIDRGLE